MKYIFFIIILCTCLFSQKLEKIKLQLQWKHQFEFAGFYIAKEKGFYEEEGLDVDFIEFKEGMDITQEVLSGNADYGLSFSSIIIDYFKNKPIVMVANFFKQSPLVLVTQKDIKIPSDLKNKKVMGLLDSTHKRTILTMLSKFDIKFDDFINIPREFSLEAFINKEVDAISVFTTNEIYTLNKLGIKYNILDPAVFGTKFYDLNLFTTKKEAKNNPLRVEKFKKASIKGWKYALENKEETVNLILNKYNPQNKSKEALFFEARQIEYLMLTNIYPIGSIDLERIHIIADNFAQSEFMNVQSKDILKEFIFDKQSLYMELTEEQKQYLKDKKELKMCVDPNWMPLEMIEDGKHMGIAAEFMNIISKKINIPIDLVITKNWTQTLNRAQKYRCDILSLAEKTPSRQKYLDFTTPYIVTPLVIVTKTGVPFINNIESIKNRKLGIVENYSIFELLKNKFPDINLVQVESVVDGLEQVQQEKIFGLIDNSIVINHEIYKRSIDDLNISGQFKESFFLSIASRNDEPILHEIMEKALGSIDSKDREKVFYKWTHLKYDKVIDYKLVSEILFSSIAILLLFIYWNFKLKEEIKNKEIAKKKLMDSEEKFRKLFDSAPVLLNSFDENGRLVLWNKECEKVFGYSFEELFNEKEPLSLFYPDIHIQKKVKDSLSIVHEEAVYKEWHPITKYGKELVTMWANVRLPNNVIINVGYDITKQYHNEIAIKEKAIQLKLAKLELENLNNTLENRIKEEIDKNTKYQITIMEQSKLAQMGEMIENISHQWRQPLAEINSTVMLIDMILSKKNILDKELDEKLLEIEQLTKYMSNTINDFKYFFEPNKIKEEFCFYENILNSLKILKGRISFAQIEIDIDIDKNISFKSYPNELNQVILAILNNSIDAIEENKIVNPIISISLKESSDMLSLSIEDNAKGIDEKIINKIFEPYFTMKHKSQGTGLGLYISKMIIEKGLNGTIFVENRNLGVCFILNLPKENNE